MKIIFLAAVLCATAGFAAVPSSTTISQGGTAGSYDLTAVVSGTGATAPSGNVSFVDNDNGGQVLATSPLVPSTTTLGQPTIRTTSVAAAANLLAAGDFNGDGILDLAAGSGSSVIILLGKGDGTFTAGAALIPASAPGALAAGRFGRQGHLDLAIANGNEVTIFSGNGDGTFTASQTATLLQSPVSLAVGSFGGAGSDLIAVGDGRISVLRGNGDGTFQPAVDTLITGVSPQTVVATSFGAVVVQAGTNPGVFIPLLNAGGGTFAVKPSIATGIGRPSIATGDFDGDGIEDVAVVNALDETVTIFSGDGSGSFTPGKPIDAGQFPTGVVAADFNNDGRADLAVGSTTQGTVTLLLGKGGGAFSSTTVTAGLNAVALVAGDFDKDGHVDLAVTDQGAANAVNVLLTQTQRTSIATASRIAPVGLGVHQVIASYAGDGTYSPSVSASTGLTTAPTVTFTPELPSLSVATLGGTASEKIVINSAGNFSGVVTLTCTVTPTGTGTIAIAPACVIDQTVTVSPQATATLSIATVAPSSGLQSPRAALGVLLFAGLIPGLRRKRKPWLLLAFAFLATSYACGDNLASFATSGTTPGTYRVDVTATATTPPFTAVTPISLTVADQ